MQASIQRRSLQPYFIPGFTACFASSFASVRMLSSAAGNVYIVCQTFCPRSCSHSYNPRTPMSWSNAWIMRVKHHVSWCSSKHGNVLVYAACESCFTLMQFTMCGIRTPEWLSMSTCSKACPCQSGMSYYVCYQFHSSNTVPRPGCLLGAMFWSPVQKQLQMSEGNCHINFDCCTWPAESSTPPLFHIKY